MVLLHLAFRHERIIEAITIAGEMEKRGGRFSKIVQALHDDHTMLKVHRMDLHLLLVLVFLLNLFLLQPPL